MTRYCLFLCLILQLVSSSAWSYIEVIKIISLKDGRQILLGFDAYRKDTVLKNQAQAKYLLTAAVKLAWSNYTKSVDLSYEDPGVYLAGNILTEMKLLEDSVFDLPAKDCFIGFAPKVAGIPKLDTFAFMKPTGIVSSLFGDFTLSSLLLHKEGMPWPKNLVVRSNDPRQEHFLQLSNDTGWMEKNAQGLRLRDFIFPAWILDFKQIYLPKAGSLSAEIEQHIKAKIDAIERVKTEQKAAFANFIAMKSGEEFGPEEVDKTLSEVRGKLNFKWIHEYLVQNKRRFTTYAEAPLLDLLLTLFRKDAPDLFIVLLGNDNASKFEQELMELKVIEASYSLAADELIGELLDFQSK